MGEPKIGIFFYGSFMDPDVLTEKGLEPSGFEIVFLRGYEIAIGEKATLARSVKKEEVYGSVMKLDRKEIKWLYNVPQLSGYMPIYMQVTNLDGEKTNVISYLIPVERLGPINKGYAKDLLETAKKLELPPSYLSKLESFV